MLWDLTLDNVGNPEDIEVWICGRHIGVMNPYLWIEDILRYCEWILASAGDRRVRWLWEREDAGLVLDRSLFGSQPPSIQLESRVSQACYLKLDLPLKVFAVSGDDTRIFLVDGHDIQEQHRLPNGAIEDTTRQVRDLLVRYQHDVNNWLVRQGHPPRWPDLVVEASGPGEASRTREQ